MLRLTHCILQVLRREPCMLMITALPRRAWSLKLSKRGQTLECRRRLLGMASSRCVRVAPPGWKAGSPVPLVPESMQRREECHDPDPNLTDLLSH